MGEVLGTGSSAHGQIVRMRAVQDRVGITFGKHGIVSRGVLTALYDQRFGPYELAKDVYTPTRTWPVDSPQGIQEFGLEICSNLMRHRIDVIAEALFAGASFEVFGPLFLARRMSDGSVYEDGSIVKISLAHPTKDMKGVLLLDSGLDKTVPAQGHNFLLVQKTGSREMLHLTTWSLAELGLFSVDWFAFYLDSIVHQNRAENPPFKRPTAEYPTVQAAYAGLCERLGITGARVE